MKKTLLLLFTLTLSVQIFSQGKEAEEDGTVWLVTGNGLKHTSYLFGTKRIGYKFTPPEADFFRVKMDSCDVVYGEVVFDSIKQDEVEKLSFMENGKKLKDLYNETDYNYIRKILNDSFQSDIQTFEDLTPMGLLNLINYFKLRNRVGEENASFSADYNIQYIANYIKKPVMGFEKPNEQAEINYRNISLPEQAKYLITSLKADEKGSFDTLLEMYKRGKIGNMQRENLKLMTPQVRQIFLDGRNEKWLTHLNVILKTKTVFVCVDAIHLGGETGLIKGLRKLGYTVAPQGKKIVIPINRQKGVGTNIPRQENPFQQSPPKK